MVNSWFIHGQFMLQKNQLTCFLFDMNFHEYSMNFHKLYKPFLFFCLLVISLLIISLSICSKLIVHIIYFPH